MSLLDDLKTKYRLAAINEKFIFVIVGAFGVIALFGAFYSLMAGSNPPMLMAKYQLFMAKYLGISSDLEGMLFKPWTFITYAFTHFSFWHMFGNIVGLYFFGRIYMTYFNTKHFVTYYIYGGLFAGLIFAISYNVFPALISKQSYLVGASASVFSVLFGVTYKAPNYIFNLFGMVRIPLWVISVLYTVLFLSSVPGGNTGGELAHLGGALMGCFLTYQLNKGNDYSIGFYKLLDWFSGLFNSKKSLKTVHRNKRKSYAGRNKGEFNEFNDQKKIDLILDKISKSGYDSLTKEEKDFLFRAGK